MTWEEIYNRADPELQTNPINGSQLTSLLKNKRGETDSAVATWSKGVKPTITGSTGLIKDPVGEANFMEMQFEAEGLIRDAKTKGITQMDNLQATTISSVTFSVFPSGSINSNLYLTSFCINLATICPNSSVLSLIISI